MKRIICLLLILLFLPLTAFAGLEDFAAARELDVVLLDNRTELDPAALRDNSDTTGYDPRIAATYVFATEISDEVPLYQVFMRMNALPDAVEIQTQDMNKRWTAVASIASPGPEFVLSSKEPVTGAIRLVVRFSKNTKLNLTECRLFGRGVIPTSLHKWRTANEADVLLMADALKEVDTAALAAYVEAGKSVALCALEKPEGDILTLTDGLWDAGLRVAPLYGGYRPVEGGMTQRIAAWHENMVVKTVTSWLRYYQPLLAVTGGDAVRKVFATANANACDYNFEVADAAAYGLWITPDSCDTANDVPARIAALAPRSYDALRAFCAQEFASAVHSDTAAIPYPAERQEDGYLPAGEFVYENPDQGLWAYLSSTVQVEIVRYEQPEIPRVWFQTDVKFKPDQEKFQQHVYTKASFVGQQIYPETLAQTSNLVLAVNGDYYPYRLDRNQAAGNILRNYSVLYNYANKNKRSFPNLDTLALLDDGTLEVYAGEEISASALAERGDVHDALSFGPYLARDGKLRIYDGYSWEVPEPRTAIGMMEAGHYRILTVEGRMPKGGAPGLNMNDLAKLMYTQNVTDAFNLDGGSTSVLIFMGTKLNLTGKGTSIGQPRNQHELFGVGTSEKTHTDMIK